MNSWGTQGGKQIIKKIKRDTKEQGGRHKEEGFIKKEKENGVLQ